MHQKTLFYTLFLAFMPVVLLAEPPQSAEKTVKYTVKSGDCLWNISRDLLKDPLKWPVIYTANEGKIGNPNLIYPGQRFTIPPPSSISRAGLKKATEVAYAKMAPISARGSPPEVAQKMGSEPAKASPPEQAMAREEAAVPAKETKAENAPPAAGTPSSSSGSGPMGLMILVVLLAAIGGFFLWKKMMGPGAPAQQPRPLSSFPEVRNVMPMPDPVQKEATEKPKMEEPPMKTGYITSISMPESEPETKAAEPASPAPSTPTTPSPEAQAPAAQPATPPPAQSADKPGDGTPPPSSTHAA